MAIAMIYKSIWEWRARRRRCLADGWCADTKAIDRARREKQREQCEPDPQRSPYSYIRVRGLTS